jgi:hypothetical protein
MFFSSPRLDPIAQCRKEFRSLPIMRKDTKLERIRQAMREENWDEALRLASRFQRLGAHAKAIQRAASAMTNPATYKELGYDHAAIRSEGIAAQKERYSKSWNEAREAPSNWEEAN